jgi:precorrin-4/cobalt-precorrin-4 C11-methyltransferase
VTVHFIGAGPGAPDLLTLRAQRLIAASPVCLYAGALVPAEVLGHAPRGARLVDTQHLDLDQIVTEIAAAHGRDEDVARLHSGDLSIWSALAEQTRRLTQAGIPFTVTPGVPSFAAAAALLRCELTVPGLAQSVVLTRTSGRASAMPERETLAAFAATGATLALHLSIHVIEKVVAELAPFYGPGCPAAVVFRATWPDERVLTGTLATIAEQVTQAGLERTALILVGPALDPAEFRESALYSPDYDRRFRPTQASVLAERADGERS